MRLCWRFGQALVRNRFVNVEPISSSSFSLCPPHSRRQTGATHVQYRTLRTEFHRRHNMAQSRSTDGWQTIGKYDVYAWSLSGLETCVVLKCDDLKLAFDLGSAIPQSVSCGNVFISHGHSDHIGGVANHASKRGLFSLKKARYYVPPLLVDSLRAVTDASFAMAVTTEALENVNIIPFGVGDNIKLPSNYSMQAFPTVHRIPSQGYILYKTVKKLKAEYVGQPSTTIAELNRNNVDIHDIITTPEVAYTGDTMMDVFLTPPSPDLLRVKLLIMEATFIDHDSKKDCVQLARDRGHIHLQEVVDNAHLFQDVGSILLVHFSTKYSAEYVRRCVSEQLPPELKDKVHCATVAKERSSS